MLQFDRLDADGIGGTRIEFRQGLEFDAGTRNAVAIQTVKLENEGWERDVSVTEPTET